jgi:hypothetical protein
MGNKNNKRKKNIIKEPIHKGKNKVFTNTININNTNLTENIIEDYIKINSISKPKNSNEAKTTLRNINNSKSLKTFENNTNEKSIKFYYNNKTKKIKYYVKFDVKSVKKILKSYFLIEESIDSIFFTDEDEDILILNSNIPDNLSVNLFIQKDLIPKNPSTALKISNNINSNNKSQKPLLKFHWVIENDKKKEKFFDCIVDKYIYKNINDDEVHPSVRSSVSFTVGTYFFVIRVGSFDCYESLAIVEDEFPDFHNLSNYNEKTFVGYQYMDRACEHKRTDIAIYIDMEKKKCRFYDYEKKKILLSGKINSDSVKLYAWLKRGCTDLTEGMTILNEGCIPIPDWVKP